MMLEVVEDCFSGRVAFIHKVISAFAEDEQVFHRFLARALAVPRTATYVDAVLSLHMDKVRSSLAVVPWFLIVSHLSTVPTLSLHRYLLPTGRGYPPHFRYDGSGTVRRSCHAAVHTGRGHSVLFKYEA